jgi:competence protein ComEC
MLKRLVHAVLFSLILILAACGAVTEESPAAGDVLDPDLYRDLLTVRYFDLPSDEKSGDAIFIRTPDGVTMMIDAGIPETGPYVDQYLDKLGIERLDYAVLTHPHYDHIGGFTTLLHTKEIGQIFTSVVPYNTNTYETVESLIEEKQIPREYLEEGDEWMLGSDVRVQVLNPPKGTTPESLPETIATPVINNHSIVLKLTYKDTSFLFPADIYKAAEAELVEKYGELLDADFLHAPHHGDETSNSGKFIDAVSPEIAVFSTNIFQSLRVEERYRDRGIEVYIPQLHGNILITSDGSELNVITEKLPE